MSPLFQLLQKHKFVCISILSILSALSFNIAVSMRETIILSLAHGASFIPFVKTYITLPCTFLVSAGYLLLQKRAGTVLTYTSINVFFLSYFVVFSLLIIPNYAMLTPNAEMIEHLRGAYPNLRHFIGLWEHWPSALFHVCAEIWSIYIFIILFWQIANESLQPGESDQFYPFVTFLISFGTTLSAYPIRKLSQSPSPAVTLLLIILPLGILMNLMVLYIHRTWGLETRSTISKHPNNLQTSIFSKLKDLFNRSLSKEVLSLSICVFSFNLLASLFESCFWTQMSHIHSTQQSLLDFYSFYTLLKGSISMFCGLLNIYLLRHFGWRNVLYITPVICIASIHLFLICHFLQGNPFLYFFTFDASTSSTYVTYFFTIGLALSYASKFSFFDPSKEILISSLPSEERRISKVFADGLSGRAGKISGGIIQSVLLSITAVDSILEISSIILIFSSILSVVFIKAILQLRRTPNTHDNPSILAL